MIIQLIGHYFSLQKHNTAVKNYASYYACGFLTYMDEFVDRLSSLNPISTANCVAVQEKKNH